MAFAGALMLLGACGGSGAGDTLASAPPGNSAPSGWTSAACTARARSVCVTSSANGQTVRLKVGWTVQVELRAPDSFWSTPSELGGRLLHQIGAIQRDRGAVKVTYRVVAPGRSDLRAFERPLCPPARMCPQYILLWEVHLRVTRR